MRAAFACPIGASQSPGSIVARVDPQPPRQETNRISTSKRRPFFLLFVTMHRRNPCWVLNDVETN